MFVSRFWEARLRQQFPWKLEGKDARQLVGELSVPQLIFLFFFQASDATHASAGRAKKEHAHTHAGGISM